MSRHAVERLLFELNRDPAKAEQLRNDPHGLFADLDLSKEERGWLTAHDVLALYRHGVHPLLLLPASRFFGMDQSALRAALAPAIGERVR